MNNNEVKDDYSYWSENLHSSYLFYTMEVDKLNKQKEQLTQKLKKAKEYLNAMVNGTHFTNDIEGHLIDLAQQALKELE